MESKLLQMKDIGDFSSVTVCYFGSCTPRASLGKFLTLSGLRVEAKATGGLRLGHETDG